MIPIKRQDSAGHRLGRKMALVMKTAHPSHPAACPSRGDEFAQAFLQNFRVGMWNHVSRDPICHKFADTPHVGCDDWKTCAHSLDNT